MRFLRSILYIVSVLTFLSGPATAQMMLPTGSGGEAVVKLDDPETKADVREMVSQLSDDSVRALLIQRLDAVAEAKEAAKANPGPSGSEIIAKGFGTLWGLREACLQQE
ncbi:hypothetical protein N9K16_03285 [Alphaproteobacteria bacterium]|nr:hypothetical protein [Alphaproteobacteria bacterium]